MIIIIILTVDAVYVFAYRSDAIEEHAGKFAVSEAGGEVISVIIIYEINTISMGPTGVSGAGALDGVPAFSFKVERTRASVVIATFLFVGEATMDGVRTGGTLLRWHLKIMPSRCVLFSHGCQFPWLGQQLAERRLAKSLRRLQGEQHQLRGREREGDGAASSSYTSCRRKQPGDGNRCHETCRGQSSWGDDHRWTSGE